MRQEAATYAPVITGADGRVEVHLGSSHPGSTDREYRARRNAIAHLALEWRPGQPVPRAPYTAQEDGVWRVVMNELAPRHERFACREFLIGRDRLGLPRAAVPQLDDISAHLVALTDFRYVPAAGLVPLRDFYEALAVGVFHSTQYLRHHSVPLYTPEPDVIHEVIGHANCLASERFAALYRAAGDAARRVETDEGLEFVSRVFWFSLEFGVVYESSPLGRELKTCGAGILSSYGELETFRTMDLHPLDITAMGTTDYDITTYQPVLFAADSFSHLEDVVGGFFATCDDESIRSLARSRTTAPIGAAR